MSAVWVKIDYCSEDYLCNNCGAVFDFNGIGNGSANYCPNCGEKMIKGGSERNGDNDKRNGIATLSTMPTAKPLTDAEQRIFLAAMEREMEVCKEINSETVREAYEVGLVKICKEIKRKVMGALWT